MPFAKGNIEPRVAVTGMGIKLRLIQMQGGGYRCLSAAGTADEHCWGFVYRDTENHDRWVNSRNDGRVYKTLTLAGRDLVERTH